MLAIRNVLLPTDHTAWSESVFANAAFFAGRHGATLHVLHVSPGRGDGPLAVEPGAGGGFRAELHRAAAEAVGLDVVYAERLASSPEAGILRYAETHGVDLVVMATHGRTGLSHFARGSVAEAVVRRAACPVLTVRPTAPHAEVEVRRLLVPVDLAAPSRLAVAHAKALATLFRAEVHLLHVLPMEPPSPWTDPDLPPAPLSEEEAARTRRALLDLYAEAPGAAAPPAAAPPTAVTAYVAASPLVWPSVGEGDASTPADEILTAAAEIDADLIVMASHGRTGLRHLLLGSVAEETVRKAPCPVFVVKPAGKSLLAEFEASLPAASVPAPA